MPINKPVWHNNIEELRNSLKKIYSNISFSQDNDSKKPFWVKRSSWGGFEIKYNQDMIERMDPDVVSLKIISSIETLESLAKAKLDEENVSEYEKFQKNSSAWAIKFFYWFIFEVISIYKSYISPSYIKRLESVLQKQTQKLAKRYNPRPKHIDFLLAIAWIEPEDNEVKEAIENLKQADILNLIFDPRQSDIEKLKNINSNILPLYKYFLGYDKFNYKPQKKIQEKVDETKNKVDEITQTEWQKPLENQDTWNPAETEDKKIDETKEDWWNKQEWQTVGDSEDQTWWQQKTPDDAQEEWSEWWNTSETEQTEKSEDWKEQSNQPTNQENPQNQWWENRWEWDSNWQQEQWNWKESSEQPWKEQENNWEQQSFPDYQDTYKTPEWWKFEKDPGWNWFKIEIHPPLLWYYVNDHKSYFNRNSLEWTNNSTLHQYTQTPQLNWNRYTLEATYSWDKLKSIPIPYSYALDLSSMKYTWDKPEIFRDENGAFYLKTNWKCRIKIDFLKEDNFNIPQPTKEDNNHIYSWKLTTQWEKAMNEALSLSDIHEKARHIRNYIRANHAYPAWKNSQEVMNNAAKIQSQLKNNSNSTNYISNLDSSKNLECYSANTLMIAMLRNIWVTSRIVTWFHIQNLNNNWNAEINSSNWHWWCEIWDWTKWVRFDATPDPDPNDPENKPDEKEKQDKENQEKQDKSWKSEKADDWWEDSDWWNDWDQNWNSSDSSDQNPSSDWWGWKTNKDNKEPWKDEKSKKKTESQKQDNNVDWNDSIDWEHDKEEFERISEEAEEWDIDENFDPEEEFKKMYDELENDTSILPDEDDIEEASNQIQEEEAIWEKEDEDEMSVRNKFPWLTQSEIREMWRFLKEFRQELSKISKLKNPDFVKWLSENETLEDELRSILDRVISRSISEHEFPRYPVDDGFNLELIDPVQLYLDKEEWRNESYSFKTIETREEEELKIVKVRRRKVLDASWSMSPWWWWWKKLEIQKQIEVLDNKVTAEKQKELEELSNELDRDLRLETETWQFWVPGPSWQWDFARLKTMWSDFHELEQATVWKLAERASWWTNDFDPLEAIMQILIAENDGEMREQVNEVSTLERIRAWFLVREINSYKELELKWDEMTHEEKVHMTNLSKEKPDEIFKLLLQFMIHTKVEQSEIALLNSLNVINAADRYKEWISKYWQNIKLSHEELEFFRNIDISNTTLVEIFDWWLQTLKSKDEKIEPILEIIEISSDWWSNDKNRLQRIVSQLRWLWIIVIAYWLWDDWQIVENVYANNFNPAEWWYFCKNLLDYPWKKAKAWHWILDKI